MFCCYLSKEEQQQRGKKGVEKLRFSQQLFPAVP